MTRDIVMLAGPTASGKTALSLYAAQRLNGEIINADSMQVYSGMDIISASPSAHERSQAPHHMFGVLDMAERCSTGRWVDMALSAIDDITGRGKTAILIGGTGLYFRALESGLADVPAVSTEVLDGLNDLPTETLRQEAETIDGKAAARIDSGDRQRLIRLISVYRQTGQTLSSFQEHTHPLLDPGRLIRVVIQPERDALYQRIEQRFDQMIEAGAPDEARAIYARGLDRDLPAMKAVGLRPLLDCLSGAIGLETAIELGKRDSRRYAKRQFTWFSNQHPDWDRIEANTPDAQKQAFEAILQRYEGQLICDTH